MLISISFQQLCHFHAARAREEELESKTTRSLALFLFFASLSLSLLKLSEEEVPLSVSEERADPSESLQPGTHRLNHWAPFSSSVSEICYELRLVFTLRGNFSSGS